VRCPWTAAYGQSTLDSIRASSFVVVLQLRKVASVPEYKNALAPCQGAHE